MKIWRFHKAGDIGNLAMEDAAVPTPAEGEALVRMEFAALNPADAFVVRGLYPKSGPPPMAVGRDGSGTIETTAAGGRFRAGERVVVLRSQIGVTRDGTLAECCAVPEASLAPLPGGWSMEQGAAGPLVCLTAWRALVVTADLQAGQLVFVNGASGGVGTATVMLAKALGARVVAGSRSAEKRAALQTLGADFVVDSSNPDAMERAFKEQLGDARADVIVENLGGAYLQASLNLVAEGGCIGVVGFLDGFMSEISLGGLVFKRARIEGVAVGAYTPPETQEAWARIVAHLDRSNRKPLIDSVFAMDAVQDAFARLATGPMGKVLVKTGSA